MSEKEMTVTKDKIVAVCIKRFEREFNKKNSMSKYGKWFLQGYREAMCNIVYDLFDDGLPEIGDEWYNIEGFKIVSDILPSEIITKEED